MANTNKPFGIRPVGNKISAGFNGQVTKYYVPSTDGTAFYVGDLVKLAGSADSDGYATVAKAGTTDATVGPVIGVLPVADSGATVVDLQTSYRKASTAAYVLVADSPSDVFEIQCNSGAVAATDVGNNASFTASTGSTTTGLSNAVLDYSTIATTTSLPLQILGLKAAPDNAFGAYAILRVRLNAHAYVNAGTGA